MRILGLKGSGSELFIVAANGLFSTEPAGLACHYSRLDLKAT